MFLSIAATGNSLIIYNNTHLLVHESSAWYDLTQGLVELKSRPCQGYGSHPVFKVIFQTHWFVGEFISFSCFYMYSLSSNRPSRTFCFSELPSNPSFSLTLGFFFGGGRILVMHKGYSWVYIQELLLKVFRGHGIPAIEPTSAMCKGSIMPAILLLQLQLSLTPLPCSSNFPLLQSGGHIQQFSEHHMVSGIKLTCEVSILTPVLSI